jgi:hypothetical protein
MKRLIPPEQPDEDLGVDRGVHLGSAHRPEPNMAVAGNRGQSPPFRDQRVRRIEMLLGNDQGAMVENA